MRYIACAVLGAALLSPALGGCDHEVSHSKETSTNPLTGTQTTKEQTTYQRPDGSTYTNKSSTSTNAPSNGSP